MALALRKALAGGIHPPERKHLTAAQAIIRPPAPESVVIPLWQHTGAPGEPLVARGDHVKLGQKIGQAAAFVSAPVHASVSGTVVAVEPRLDALGRMVTAVVIESDGLDTPAPEVVPRSQPDSLSADEIRNIVHQAGIVGLGGAAFPTRVKLAPPADKPIDTYILNGCECEPYLTGDHRVMLERGADCILGLGLLMKAAGVTRGYLAVENNKPDAVEALLPAAREAGIAVAVLPTRYPQGSEKHLIKSLLGREVPSGGLPMDVGVLVSNVGTAVAVADAVYHGLPLLQRVVTVTGRPVRQPANLLLRLGTSFAAAIALAGGLGEPAGRVVMGGPMTGTAQFSLDVPVVKGTSGILVLGRDESLAPVSTPCIRCGRCAESCPMRLLPLYFDAYVQAGNYSRTGELGVLDCIECGSCAWGCPARRPLVHSIRVAKGEARKRS
ncbi:MAG: electron transport complex subunit RsxC [bacterium]|nr:electron transport complex subunit RsxC [bacterium]